MIRLALLALFFCACGGAEDTQPDLTALPYDLATAPADAGLQCGATACDVGNGNVCCVEPDFEFCGSAEACSAGIALYCDGAADCLGGSCCLTGSVVGCSSTCTGSTVCRVDDDCPAATPRCCAPIASGSLHRTCAATCG